MSYLKAAELLKFAMDLSASRLGLTLPEIDSRSPAEGKSARRNTQRLLEAIRDVFGNKLIEEVDYDGRKRVRLERSQLKDLIDLEAEELASLDHAIVALRAQNDTFDASRLESLRTKVRLMAPSTKRRKIEVDYEALLGASSVIARPGPRPRIAPDIMAPITEAILSLKQLAFTYWRGEHSEERVVSPLGVMMGHRVYLVAQLAGSARKDPPVWRVDRMTAVRVLDTPAAIPESFDLATFSSRAFGAFHNRQEYGEVVWKFSAEAAESARSFYFHPQQVLEEHMDGSLTVRFLASGYLEMAWFLYAWGNHVEVVTPSALKELVAGHQRNDFPGLP